VRLTELIDRYGADVVRAAIAEMRHRAAQPDAREDRRASRTAATRAGGGRATASSTSRSLIRMRVTKKGDDLTFDMSGSSPPCRGPMNSVIATTKSSIYLAVKHIFPDVPINAGTFEPLRIVEPEGTFLYAHYPRPVSGCAAEVSQRIAEAVFAALTNAIPDLLFAAPAGTSGNLAHRRLRSGAQAQLRDVSSSRAAATAASRVATASPTAARPSASPRCRRSRCMEQFYPVLFEEFSLREGSGGAGEFRGGFGVNYAIRLRRGEARASMVMDHGRTGPQGALGGAGRRRPTRCRSTRAGKEYRPPHLSKDQDIEIAPAT
jgi:N-methylhydantoinase B